MSLDIINNFTYGDYSAHQGNDSDDADTAYEITLTNDDVTQKKGSLASGAGLTLWDEDTDVPVDFEHFWFKATQTCYLQVIGQATNFTVKVTAKVPFVLSTDDILAAADTTPLSAEPTTEAVDSIRIWNESGSSLDYTVAFFN